MSSNSCLKIGERLLCDDQIIEALVEYKLFEPLVGQVILDRALATVALSEQEVYHALADGEIPAAASLEEFLIQWCQQNQVSEDYLHKVVLRGLRLNKFKQSYFEPKIISEFLRIKPDLDQVEYSRIRVGDFFLAQELYFQIQDDGADFLELARQHSLDGESLDGSWIEPTSLASLPPEISNLFKNGQEGKLYKPVLVDDLFWVVRLERIYPARLTASMRSLLRGQLYNDWLQAQIAALVSQPGAIAVQQEGAVDEECLVL